MRLATDSPPMPDATDRLDRRTLLRATGTAAAMGVLPGAASAASAAGTDQDALVLAYHDAARNLIYRTLVVYGDPVRPDRPVCEFDDAWRHPVVAVGFEGGEMAYADLHAGEQFQRGTAVVVVDRVQGCAQGETEYAGVFLDVVARPPGADGGGGGGSGGGGGGSDENDTGNETAGEGDLDGS